MGVRSRGRSVAATFGLLLVLAGVAGAGVLWVMAERRPEQAIEGFARGPVGCTTTLEFGEVGTFYIYEEVVGATSDVFAGCAPDATPGSEFSAELLDDGRAIATRTDTSIAYDTDDAFGTSVARLEIGVPGRYDLVVEGLDPTVVAAVGRDPQQGVDELRRGAFVVGVVGVVLGALMLLLAGRRSRRAATVTPSAGPDRGTAPRTDTGSPAWPPEPPRVRQALINPMSPPEPLHAEPGQDSAAPLVPPRAGERRDLPPSAGPEWGTASRTDTGSPAWPPEPPRVRNVLINPMSPPEPADAEPGQDSSAPWAPPRAGERRDPPPPG